MIFSALLLQSPASLQAFKQRFLRRLGLVGLILGSAVCMYNLSWGILFFMGLSIGFGYILSLFLTVESGQRKFTQVLSIFRMLIVSFLIVWVGHFKLLETSIVICGFLSYKVVLSLEFIDSLIGSKEHRGK